MQSLGINLPSTDDKGLFFPCLVGKMEGFFNGMKHDRRGSDKKRIPGQYDIHPVFQRDVIHGSKVVPPHDHVMMLRRVHEKLHILRQMPWQVPVSSYDPVTTHCRNRTN